MKLKSLAPLSALAVAVALALAAPAGQAAVTYVAFMDGPSEFPPVASPGTGTAFVTYDEVAHTLAIQADWSGLIGPTTVAHIHCCTAVAGAGTIGVAVTPGTFPGFPVGVTAGTYAVVLDLTAAATFTAAFVTNFAGGVLADAEEALIAGFNAGRAYFNIHTSFAPGGEIRGFLAVPEPATAALLGLGLLGLGTLRRKAA